MLKTTLLDWVRKCMTVLNFFSSFFLLNDIPLYVYVTVYLIISCSMIFHFHFKESILTAAIVSCVNGSFYFSWIWNWISVRYMFNFMRKYQSAAHFELFLAIYENYSKREYVSHCKTLGDVNIKMSNLGVVWVMTCFHSDCGKKVT
jgi:hypothetical protein